MIDFSDLFNKRRSIRDFEDKEVPLDCVKEIIQESCLAPSSGNGQPWRFIIINRKDMMKRLSDESKKNYISFMETHPDAPVKQYESILRNKEFNVFYNAPCLIYIVGPKKVPSLHVDCALFACYFMFSACARGLGTCWIQLGAAIQNPETLQEIGMPDDHRIIAPIILGYPKNIPALPGRKDPVILKVIS